MAPNNEGCIWHVAVKIVFFLLIAEYLSFQVTDTGMTGSADQVRDDMKLIADLVVKKMEEVFHPHIDREVTNTTTAALSGRIYFTAMPVH